MREHNFDLSSHIGGYYIPEKICDDLVDLFHSQKHLHVKGGTKNFSGHNIDLDTKDSTEFSIHYGYHEGVIGEYRKYLHECLQLYIKKYPQVNSLSSFGIIQHYNIQHYGVRGGFKKWHFENASIPDRCLVFMTYLNSVDDGGTEFFYQNLISPAKKGLTIIWPAYWTHTHRGQISNTKEKYIVTGWYTIMEENNE